MKVPKNVLIIGAFHLLEYRIGTYRADSMPQQRSFRSYLIATTQANSALYLFENNTTGKKEILEDPTGKQGGYIHTAMEYKIPTVNLKKIGIVESVQYSTDWWEGHFEKYEHIFTKHPALYADRESRFRVMAIKPARGRIVTKRGITG